MEKYLFLILTFLGFFIAQVINIQERSRKSSGSPENFNILFFLKDTWQKLLLSLALSFSLAYAFSLVAIVEEQDAQLIDLGSIKLSIKPLDVVYLAIGAIPEFLIQYLRNKFGFTKPETVTIKEQGEKQTYYRK